MKKVNKETLKKDKSSSAKASEKESRSEQEKTEQQPTKDKEKPATKPESEKEGKSEEEVDVSALYDVLAVDPAELSDEDRLQQKLVRMLVEQPKGTHRDDNAYVLVKPSINKVRFSPPSGGFYLSYGVLPSRSTASTARRALSKLRWAFSFGGSKTAVAASRATGKIGVRSSAPRSGNLLSSSITRLRWFLRLTWISMDRGTFVTNTRDMASSIGTKSGRGKSRSISTSTTSPSIASSSSSAFLTSFPCVPVC